ncbi:hypothetical protein C789_4216 [Microcystis aeruginosa FACHB-905 = DIANCHI905]|nr:hypothetical protein C789_4216 [Microcystis aeruginosa FACHB-905 = DIANCHI905]
MDQHLLVEIHWLLEPNNYQEFDDRLQSDSLNDLDQSQY